MKEKEPRGIKTEHIEGFLMAVNLVVALYLIPKLSEKIRQTRRNARLDKLRRRVEKEIEIAGFPEHLSIREHDKARQILTQVFPGGLGEQ